MADEEDEDVLESWEEAVDSGELERRMEEREKAFLKEEQEARKHEMNIANSQGPVTILKAENAGRTEYTPQIKILKRSGNLNEKKDTVKQTSEAELKKTLKLREAEYQAARNRILGEDYDETKPDLEECVEDDNEARISIIKAPSRESSASASTPTASQSSIGCSQNLIRQPKGPDSQTSGFSIER